MLRGPECFKGIQRRLFAKGSIEGELRHGLTCEPGLQAGTELKTCGTNAIVTQELALRKQGSAQSFFVRCYQVRIP